MSAPGSLDGLKQQILAISAVKGDSITNLIWSFLLITLVEHLFSFIPMIKEAVQSLVANYFKKTKQTFAQSIIKEAIPKEKTANIFFKRYFISSSQNSNGSSGSSQSNGMLFEAADAIIELVSTLDSAKNIVSNKFFYITHCNVIEINPKVFFQIQIVKEQNEDISLIEFELFSYDYTLSQLQDYVSRIVEESRIKKLNKLGNKLYYFNEVSMANSRFAQPGVLGFQMIPFFTNKSLSNVYGPQFRLIKNRIDFFMNNEEWYREKGVPYTLGMMVYGPPGTGKTSCIKAISNTTKRHIVNIHLTDSTTKSQLQNLFYDDKLMVEKANGQTEWLTIPCNKRIYVMEDIDCLSNIILDRSMKVVQEEIQKKEEEQKQKTKQNNMNMGSPPPNMIPENEKLTLSFLLNLFDGVLETPGRILVMSSNYPEKIDKALMRPGRIDLNIRFGECDADTIREMVHHAYDLLEEDLKLYEFANGVYTPAQVNQILFNHIDNPTIGIESLLAKNAIKDISPVHSPESLSPKLSGVCEHSEPIIEGDDLATESEEMKDTTSDKTSTSLIELLSKGTSETLNTSVNTSKSIEEREKELCAKAQEARDAYVYDKDIEKHYFSYNSSSLQDDQYTTFG